MDYSPEAQKVHEAQLRHGINLADRFGLLEVAGEVVREAMRDQKARILAELSLVELRAQKEFTGEKYKVVASVLTKIRRGIETGKME